MKVLRWLWAAPWRLVARIIAFLWPHEWGTFRHGELWGCPGSHIIEATGPVARWFANRGWAGFTFADHVWLWVRAEWRLVRHEYRHVGHWAKWGVLAPAVYLALLVRYGYNRHPWERDARIASGESADGLR